MVIKIGFENLVELMGFTFVFESLLKMQFAVDVCGFMSKLFYFK